MVLYVLFGMHEKVNGSGFHAKGKKKKKIMNNNFIFLWETKTFEIFSLF